ncbi:MAG: hypothetical protein D6768_11760 [Chloroflexi bacterium]|nr:MAG: hypothetical protein D6768_11760 [Chloroflexota bacterium]
MPLQNRVDPFSILHAVPYRGTCMGNRGILHNSERTVTRYHQHKRWLICKLAFANRHRPVMAPGRYTELFFLDEATALAAGHRPCAECDRARYREFVDCWRRGNPEIAGQKLDDVLHRDRFRPYRRNWRTKKYTYSALIDSLPSGTFILLNPDPSSQPYLIWDGRLLPWSFEGYGSPVAPRPGVDVVVLTPQATVNTLAAGYRPKIHPEIY